MIRKKLIIPFLLFYTVFISCVKETKPVSAPPANFPSQPTQPQPSNKDKKYLALGDSYTIGQGVPPTDRYPVQTREWLLANGITGIKEPEIIATTGWTTINLQSAIETQKPTGPFDVVSILIGVNDQYQRMEAAGYTTRFTELLKKCISLADNKPSHVFVLSIPDYSVTPFGKNMDPERVSKEIDNFNAINKQVALSYNVQYLDITPSSRQAATDASLVCSDGLHPSGIEYKKWAERLGTMMKVVLE
jgi:lysophospholipase L1-like esterase